MKFTVDNSASNSAANEDLVTVKTLDRRINEKIDREKSIIVDTVKGRIQNAILTASHSIFIPEIELALRSTNASSGNHILFKTAETQSPVGMFFVNEKKS